MAKTANLYARIEPDVKAQAEDILAALGIPVSNAINMFYKQIILQRGIPFELKLPSPNVPDMSKMTQEDLDRELEKGWQDVLDGRTVPAEKVFSDLRKNTDYELCCRDVRHSAVGYPRDIQLYCFRPSVQHQCL